jgi:CRP-like cAMP-binding protein
VKIYRILPGGEEAVVGVFNRGKSFAEAAMFLGGRYPACAEVVSQARLLRVDGVTFRNQIRETPDLAMAMLASASFHLKHLVEQIEQIKLLSAAQRIADFLIERCPTREGACAVDLPYEKTLIANRLGMKPESFSRALAKLKPLGVTVNRERVDIADVRALIDFVERGEDE